MLVWAVAALAGWMLLRDQAQQALALLVPAWMACELAFRAQGSIGDSVYVGRLLFTWAILYLTFFAGSRRNAVRGILFVAGAIAAVVGVTLMLTSWTSWSSMQTFIPFGTRVGAWMAIAGLPLMVAAFHGHKGLIPIAAAVAFVLALPWCYRTWSYPGRSRAEGLTPVPTPRPICWRTRWWRVSRCSCAHGACAWPRVRW